MLGEKSYFTSQPGARLQTYSFQNSHCRDHRNQTVGAVTAVVETCGGSGWGLSDASATPGLRSQSVITRPESPLPNCQAGGTDHSGWSGWRVTGQPQYSAELQVAGERGLAAGGVERSADLSQVQQRKDVVEKIAAARLL
ncbi:hypothetical protein AAFF_G00437870 [Aldrovandia affinis]|uniref:Uncharacterized protein n=1 Tax=Aldrovandia affinis TaxID=143900 RepID=A0AAD7WHR7_9TELE|nr:hypothetical protein AAFF_G00437870 [Aldrovandia affinis]